MTWLLPTVVAVAGLWHSQAAEPIRLHPDNPHYFLWRGKPAILLTAGEHYGAVLNLDFDFQRYLEELKAHRFNLTRVFAGTYREVPGSFNITGNTLAPAEGRFVCPWARSQTPGASDGGNKFDLEKWDETYFRRLKRFVRAAGERNVAVELVLFCTMYEEALWQASPMNPRNNVNGLGTIGRYDVFSGKDPKLLAIQEAVTRKLVAEMNSFDNLYFEICNEPYERGGLTKSWNDRIVRVVRQAEAALPNKHLIAQGFPPAQEPIVDLNPQVSVLNFHAAKPDAARLNYRQQRVLALDETGGSDKSDRKYRTEAWEWLLAGGAVYDHLDLSFTTGSPSGAAVPLPEGTPGGGGPELRRQLSILKEFVETLNFIGMAPSNELLIKSEITQAKPDKGRPTVSVLAAPGLTYAIHVNGGCRAELLLDLPPGSYKAEWVNTKNGRIEQTESFVQTTAHRSLASPDYTEDIALRIFGVPSSLIR